MARNMLKWGTGILNTQWMPDHTSESVTYMRGSQEVGSSLKATIGTTEMQQDAEAGVLRWESKDFIFQSATLTLGGSIIEPKRGDRVIDTDGNAYEVLGADGGPPLNKGEYGDRVRVHTKQVTAVAT